ncbi:hypothetical protein IEQ34_022535 [Dendrobium chrysotoxum]|uniref:Uncharacterized protein n=1 Tax=Dendrobium chrysotoxum TaxID=161865 RepID=A0AAV7FXR5_DENCH|nr:hypothetical protein IEQ34_022535 [Dendrobium chrysotoxum]
MGLLKGAGQQYWPAVTPGSNQEVSTEERKVAGKRGEKGLKSFPNKRLHFGKNLSKQLNSTNPKAKEVKADGGGEGAEPEKTTKANGHNMLTGPAHEASCNESLQTLSKGSEIAEPVPSLLGGIWGVGEKESSDV